MQQSESNLSDKLLIIILIVSLLSLLFSFMGWKSIQNMNKLGVGVGVGVDSAIKKVVSNLWQGKKMAGANSPSATLTLYSASWCGSCKFFRPTWEKLKESYADSTSVKFKEVDCSDSSVGKRVADTTVLKDGEKIRGWPTVTIQCNNDIEEKFAGPGETVNQLTDKINSKLV